MKPGPDASRQWVKLKELQPTDPTQLTKWMSGFLDIDYEDAWNDEVYKRRNTVTVHLALRKGGTQKNRDDLPLTLKQEIRDLQIRRFLQHEKMQEKN
jgi:hypothetical protein